MKLASLIFGDKPKKADSKLASPQPGQIVRSIDGSALRVTSKIAGPDGYVVKLANLQGKPVSTPANFRPVGSTMARLASWLRYHLAYNKDFDLYVNAYIEQYNEQHPKEQLAYPVGKDGQPFRWSNWFQKVVSPKIYSHGDSEQQQHTKDELIHEMLFTTLGHRHILDQFVAKNKGKKLDTPQGAVKLTDFLISTFMYRIDEMRNKFKEHNPEEEISMYQPSTSDEGGDEMNLLEQEGFGVGETEFQSAEAKRDIAKFREGFNKWLISAQGEKSANSFTLMFDLFWKLLSESSSEEVPRREVEKEWMEKTGLSFGSFKDYFSRLPDMIEQYITTKGGDLGEKSVFVDLMNIIRGERTKRLRKERQEEERKKRKEVKEKARPAMVSSLNTAGIEGDIAEAIGQTVNPDTVDSDIKQPTVSVNEAGKQSHAKRAKLDVVFSNDKGFVTDFGQSHDMTDETNAVVGTIPRYGVWTSDPAVKQGRPQVTQTTDDIEEAKRYLGEGKQSAADDKYTCMKCHRTSKESDCNNLQCPHCGGSMREKTAAKAQPAANAAELIASIRPGDRVTILRPAGIGRDGQEWAEATGRAVMPSSHGGWVLNMGGAHGTPGLAGEENIVAVRHSKRSSFEKSAKLLRGDELTPEMRKLVQDAFIYRWTKDNPRRAQVYKCDKCDVANAPYENSQSAEGHQHPTIPLQTDDQWIAEHAFYFLNDGRLDSRHRNAEPVYLAKSSHVANIGLQFAIEKSAMHTGVPAYMYQAALYCEHCADGIKKDLALAGKAVPQDLDETQYDSDSYPKGPYADGGGEADTPQHCDRCGKFLENPLTEDGYKWLRDNASHPEFANGAGNHEVMQEWIAFYPEAFSGLEKESADEGQLACCGGWHGRHRINCSVYSENFDNTVNLMKSYKKEGMLGHDFKDRDGQAITNETESDTGRQPHQKKEGADEEASVAQTILEQLGGRKFIAMTGARNLVNNGNGLSFKLPGSGGFTKNGINVVSIDLTPSDTYKVTFSRVRAGKVSVVAEHDDVYVDSLHEIFERETGLATSLGTMGKSGAEVPTENWQCIDCGHEGMTRTDGTCEACGSPAVDSISMKKEPTRQGIDKERFVPDWKTRYQDQAVASDKTAESREEWVDDHGYWRGNCQIHGPFWTDGSGCESCLADQQDIQAEPEEGQFRCGNCGDLFEDSQKFLSEGHPYCPNCINEFEPGMSPTPMQASKKKADTIQSQTQNAFIPGTPNKAQPMAVPEAQDQTSGPHSPNAPGTAPRTPGIQPKIVGVPPGTVGEDETKIGSEDADWESMHPEENEELAHSLQQQGEEANARHDDIDDSAFDCGECGGQNTEIDQREDGGYDVYCNTCEEVTFSHPGANPRFSPETGYDMFAEGRLVQPDDKMLKDQDFAKFMKSLGASAKFASTEALRVAALRLWKAKQADEMLQEREPDEYDRVMALPEEQKAEWLLQHGWQKENEWHGATWWMGKQQWWLPEHEESIPYQGTDDAVEKQLDMMMDDAGNMLEKQGAGTPAVVAPAVKPVLPNVVQNQSIHPAMGPGQSPGATMAIMPGQGEDEPGGITRHTVEPDLPNAKYHMQGAQMELLAAEEDRLAKNAGLNSFKITFEDGNTITTDFNGTLEDAQEYYLNNYFNFGDTDENPKDNLQKGVSVEQLGVDPNARVNEYLRDMAARGFEPVPETVEALKNAK